MSLLSCVTVVLSNNSPLIGKDNHEAQQMVRDLLGTVEVVTSIPSTVSKLKKGDKVTISSYRISQERLEEFNREVQGRA